MDRSSLVFAADKMVSGVSQHIFVLVFVFPSAPRLSLCGLLDVCAQVELLFSCPELMELTAEMGAASPGRGTRAKKDSVPGFSPSRLQCVAGRQRHALGAVLRGR